MTTTTEYVQIPEDVLSAVEDHVFGDTSRELGGVLVGRLPEYGPAQVNAAIPALEAVGHRMNVTFTHDVWESVLEQVESDYPGQRIVGWYHSHPGFGIFLSEYDSFIQANFFSDPRMVALVVDPLAGRRGWFSYIDSAVSAHGEQPTARPAVAPENSSADAQSPAPKARLSSRTKGSLVLAAAAVLFSGFVVGYLSAPEDDAPVPAASSELPPDYEPPLVPDATTPDKIDVTYTVQRGDTLWRISEALLGEGAEYVVLLDANPGIEPADLAVGQQLTVPVTGETP